MEQVTTKSGNLACTTENGVIQELSVNGVVFNGFPGQLKLSPGLQAKVTWNADGEALICDIQATRVSGSADDEGCISYRFPYYKSQGRLEVWSAREGFPKTLYDIGGTELIYGDICYGTLLPMASLYNRKEKIGLTVARIPGRTGGRLSFRFDDYHQEGMSVIFSALSIPPGVTRSYKLIVFGHGPCWRPGLKQYIDRYPEYFTPVNPETWNCRSFIMSTAFFTEDACREYPADWAEIHNHFPHYGTYLPEENTWQSVIGHDFPKAAAGRDITLSREQIHKHIRDLHAAGTRAMLYVQCGGDGSIEWAEKTFPESIARDSAGHLYTTWIECCFMNGDPSTPFGKYLEKQLDGILKEYPELDGFFVDQLCYQAFDFAHPDGRSARLGRQAGEYGATIEKQFRRFAEKAHRQGKLILSNGAFDMDVSLGADAVMSEGANSLFRTTRYVCVRRPMLMYTPLTSEFAVEAMLRSAMLTGAGWAWGGTLAADHPKQATPEMKELYRKYLPLLETMFGAELVLSEDPVTCTPPSRAEADLFRSRENGHFLAPVLEKGGFLSAGITLKLRPGESVSSARIRTVHDDDWKPFDFTEKDGELTFKMPVNFSAAVIELLP